MPSPFYYPLKPTSSPPPPPAVKSFWTALIWIKECMETLIYPSIFLPNTKNIQAAWLDNMPTKLYKNSRIFLKIFEFKNILEYGNIDISLHPPLQHQEYSDYLSQQYAYKNIKIQEYF